MLTKIETKLNKNNKYRNHIEYRTLTLTCARCWIDMWTFKKIKKLKRKIKNHEVTRDS